MKVCRSHRAHSAVREAPCRAAAPVGGAAAGGAVAGWVAAQAVDTVGVLVQSAMPASFAAPAVDGWLGPLLVGSGGPLPGLLGGAVSAGLIGYFAARPAEPEGWFRTARARGLALRDDYVALAQAPPGQRLLASARLGNHLGREAGKASGALQGALWGARLGLRLAGPALTWAQKSLPPGALPPGAQQLIPLVVAGLGVFTGQAVGATCGGWIGSLAGGAAGAVGGMAVGPLITLSGEGAAWPGPPGASDTLGPARPDAHRSGQSG